MPSDFFFEKKKWMNFLKNKNKKSWRYTWKKSWTTFWENAERSIRRNSQNNRCVNFCNIFGRFYERSPGVISEGNHGRFSVLSLEEFLKQSMKQFQKKFIGDFPNEFSDKRIEEFQKQEDFLWIFWKNSWRKLSRNFWRDP